LYVCIVEIESRHKKRHMNTEERIKMQRELVEAMGRNYDKEGFQPIAGRILGLLTVMDKEKFTFDEITEELQISKSSASNALKMLEIRDRMEYVTLPGDRKRYFQLKKHEPVAVINDIKKKVIDSKALLQRVVDLKADQNSSNALFIKDMILVLDFFLSAFERTDANFKK